MPSAAALAAQLDRQEASIDELSIGELQSHVTEAVESTVTAVLEQKLATILATYQDSAAAQQTQAYQALSQSHENVINELKACKDLITAQTAQITSLQHDIELLRQAPAPARANPLTPPNSTPITASRSYASAATSRADSIPASGSVPGQNRRQNRPRSTPAPRLDLNLEATGIDTQNAEALQGIMDKALQAKESTRDIKCLGIGPKRPERTAFFFANQTEVDKVKAAQPWLANSDQNFNKARLIDAGNFKIKISGVDRAKLGVVEPGQKVAQSFINAVNAASGKSLLAARLLNPGSDSPTAQLVAMCSTEQEMERLLADRYIPIGEASVASVSFFYDSQERTCRHCRSLGHLIRACPNKDKCLRCGEKDHGIEECSTPPRCFNCLGNHTTVDRTCPIKARQIARRYE